MPIAGYKDIGNFEIGPGLTRWAATGGKAPVFVSTSEQIPASTKTIPAWFTWPMEQKMKKFKGLAEAFWVVKRELQLEPCCMFPIAMILITASVQYGEVSQDNLFSIAIRNQIPRRFNTQQINFNAFKRMGQGFPLNCFLAHRRFTPLLNMLPKDSSRWVRGIAQPVLKLRWSCALHRPGAVPRRRLFPLFLGNTLPYCWDHGSLKAIRRFQQRLWL